MGWWFSFANCQEITQPIQIAMSQDRLFELQIGKKSALIPHE
jgi:hypothetical protein